MFDGTYLLTENGSLLSKTMQTLWKETKFHNRIDTPAFRRPIDSEWRITLVVELSDDISCVLIAMLFHSTHLMNDDVKKLYLRLFSLPNVPLPAVDLD